MVADGEGTFVLCGIHAGWRPCKHWARLPSTLTVSHHLGWQETVRRRMRAFHFGECQRCRSLLPGSPSMKTCEQASWLFLYPWFWYQFSFVMSRNTHLILSLLIISSLLSDRLKNTAAGLKAQLWAVWWVTAASYTAPPIHHCMLLCGSVDPKASQSWGSKCDSGWYLHHVRKLNEVESTARALIWS